jgi:negative regulator of sigma E activity
VRRPKLALVAALALAALGGAAPAGTVAAAATAPPKADARTSAEANADALVREAVEAPKHVSYVGQLSSIRSGPRRAYAVVAKIEHRAPDDTRRTYLAPQALYGQYVITKGTKSWDVDPDRKRVVVSENRAADDQVVARDDLALLEANYRAVDASDDNIADRRTDVIDLVNRYTGERIMRLWLDQQTHIVLAKEEYHGDGSLAWRTRYDAIRFTGDIPKEIFSVTLPRDYASVQGASYGHPSEDLTRAISETGFTPVGPKYLPEGFAVVSADLSDIKGVKNLHLIYTDGIRTMSLFENATGSAIDFGGMKSQTISFEGHPAEYVRDGPTTLLAWRERGLAFALVGDLDLKDLTRIAISLVP